MENQVQNPKPSKAVKPDIFGYHDYLQYLKDWLAYRKTSQSRFSLRSLAREVKLSPAYLSLVISGSRKLTSNALLKLAPAFRLTHSERSYLDLLVVLGTSDSSEARLDALERMKRFRSYRKANPKEFEVYKYLTRWYYLAIREMAGLPDFKIEPSWIQERLRHRVDLGEIRGALDFLIENKYLEVQRDGSVRPPDKRIDCLGGVYRMAIAQFHRQMLSLAADSIESIPSDERRVLGHGIALDTNNFDKACNIIEEAFEKIRQLDPATEKCDSVYFAELALFPLTKKKEIS